MSGTSGDLASDSVSGPPAGWTRIEFADTHFADQNGPLYLGTGPDGELRVGLRVERRHCNVAGVCHGGMLMTLADMIPPLTTRDDPRIVRRFMPTISMSNDFLAPAPLGSWLSGRAEVLRVTRNLVFTQGMIEADSIPVLRTSGVFKLSKATGDDGG